MTLAPVKRADVRPGERRRWCATWIEACSLIAERAVTADDLHLGPCEFPEWDGDGDDPRYAIVDRPNPFAPARDPVEREFWSSTFLTGWGGGCLTIVQAAERADTALDEWRKRWSK